MKKYGVIELFAGCGGLALGLEKAGLKTELLVEIDKDCVGTLRQNRPNWKVIQEDVSKVDFKDMKADVVTGGFPCQAFSYAGKKLGFEDTRGTLFFEFARCIKEVQPKIFIGENVEGLLRHEGGKTLQIMLDVLNEMDYNIKYKLLNAVQHGVPQKRKRLIIVGTRKDISFEYPEPQNKFLTMRDALKNVPRSPGQKFSESRAGIMKLVPPGGCWVNLPVELQKEYMGASYYSGGGKRGMARRIAWDEPCLTLTTSPSQKQTERAHPDENRPLTVREYARVQTFPDEWEFTGGMNSQYKQIGNAVPVELGRRLGLKIIEALEGKTKSPTEKQTSLFEARCSDSQQA